MELPCWRIVALSGEDIEKIGRKKSGGDKNKNNIDAEMTCERKSLGGR